MKHNRRVVSSVDIDVDYIGKGWKVLVLKCRHCGKFIKRDWKKWYCPHCDVSFIPHITRQQMEDVEELLDYMERLDEYGRISF